MSTGCKTTTLSPPKGLWRADRSMRPQSAPVWNSREDYTEGGSGIGIKGEGYGAVCQNQSWLVTVQMEECHRLLLVRINTNRDNDDYICHKATWKKHYIDLEISFHRRDERL